MPTKKTIFWILAAAILYLIAWNVGGGWLYALIAILLAFPLASVFLSRLNTRSITVGLQTPDRCVQGEELRATVTVSNASLLPRYLVRLSFEFAGSAASVLLVRIGGKSRTSVAITFKNVRRGIYGGCDCELSSKAPVGLARSRRRQEPPCPVVVYPHWHTLPADWVSGGRSQGYAASSSMSVRKPSNDYLGVREYRSEDSPRSIHWKTSARSNRLVVVEYAHQLTVTPAFIVDPFREAVQGPPDDSSFEAAVSVAASLVQREAAYNRRFGCGTSLTDTAERGLTHDPAAAMLMLAGLEADAGEPLAGKATDTGWSEITPVLIVTSHRCYADLARSDLVQDHPGTLVVMIDGRLYTDNEEAHGRLLEDGQIAALEMELAAAGSRLFLLDNREGAARCLESL